MDKKEGTRVFGGKRYGLYGVFNIEKEAQGEAQLQRGRGFYARVTRARPLWFVWLRKSYRGEY